MKRGLTAYCCFIRNGFVKSFDNLEKEYGLERQDFFHTSSSKAQTKNNLTEDFSCEILKISQITSLGVEKNLHRCYTKVSKTPQNPTL